MGKHGSHGNGLHCAETHLRVLPNHGRGARLLGEKIAVDAMLEGHYARKQLGCKSWIISWSHGARFRTAARLVGTHPGDKLLDYGCGDGTFLGLVADKFAACVGTDVAADQIEDCTKRFQAVQNLRFCMVSQLAEPGHAAGYRVVTCMETLEHCTEPVVDEVLKDLNRLAAPDGTIVISVPVEIGPTFLFKYVIRKIAAWRGLGDYRYYESYSLRNGLRMLFASSRTDVSRPVYGRPGEEYHSHYGFNWRRLRRQVSQALIVERTLFSPLGLLGGWVSSQAWFVCRPKPVAAKPAQADRPHQSAQGTKGVANPHQNPLGTTHD
jgi:SAM-dependent methyltransferase